MVLSSQSTKMQKPRSRGMARLGDVLSSDYSVRFERHLTWLRNPLAAVALAMVASFLCGVFLHPQGFVLAFGLATLLGVGLAWPWLSVRGLSGSLSFEKTRTREGQPVKALLVVSNHCPWAAVGLAVHGGFRHGEDKGLLNQPDLGLPRAAGWKTTASSWDVVLECRGEHRVDAPLIASGFPFGLWAAARAQDRGQAASLASDVSGRPNPGRRRRRECRRIGATRQAGDLGRSAGGPALSPRGHAPPNSLAPDRTARTARRLRGSIERRAASSDRARRPPGRPHRLGAERLARVGVSCCRLHRRGLDRSMGARGARRRRGLCLVRLRIARGAPRGRARRAGATRPRRWM